MSKHTLGPWHCNNKVGYVFSPECLVARVGDFQDEELKEFNADRWNADARLIAAAPDLLECLAVVSADRWVDLSLDDQGEWLDRSRAAIAKARGED